MATAPMLAKTRLTSIAGRHHTLPSLDDIGAGWPSAHPKAAALAFLVALVVAPATTRAARHGGGGDDGDAVLLVGLGEHPTHGDRIADRGD